ncbi:phosphonate C-P lyase system protein PhnH [Afifella marina]|uniref:Alpha-D-ribose 1-methylphosphonate 5-triphosphate synthase subunit PhnH n=1 Tax=Afifella marina DSM 2698 TaxID=1120955 RepID=A0A1G5MVP8_AFIMA|nr:phosphonate C-P lyase system protein PhnH [Afifella marina]MBK1621984.1 phosphonate C-P lyase system protein PhnH [Afifella marina DSM 2698]MBK1627777.1 phosphonate C-P lyase system protein PhnH [Afifella marina]MBK5916744.1 phosphonate C-P lyase system protein PhnH [Afifella marina]RAI19929.1 phosphonate C-P lyase system protein PhnH [Afifella marina DSM 2698]SCZ28649.1 alpha-D-ribose 1-methylphosphonate 5-triphosphate synthase subunit PhnH [Afifella marina DSM 2698]
MADALGGGFKDPVFASQAVFRRLLDALSRPGRVVEMPQLVAPPPPLKPAAAAVLAALADADTPVFLDKVLNASGEVRGWVGFHIGAPIVVVPARALFAVIADPAVMPPLSEFGLGTEQYPDRSTTLVVQVAGFSRGRSLWLSGPGIEDVAGVQVEGLPERLVEEFRANRALFPRGVDLVLAAPSAILGLPRSTRIMGEA